MSKGGVTEYRHLIHGGKGVAAIYTRRTSGSPLTDTFYVHSDHLGSPELITNAAGAEVVKLSFGAYGERRDRDWDGPVTTADSTAIGNTIRHGFTGHEHLDSVNLIHMNGRVYDPVVGRFLSADPFIDWGLGTQGANRYGYVGNNPLSRVDPTGFECQDNPEGGNITGCEFPIDVWNTPLPYDECDWGGPWMAGCTLYNWLIRQGRRWEEQPYDDGGSSGGEAEAPSEPEPPQNPEEKTIGRCVNKGQLVAGTLAIGSGAVQLTYGVASTLLGVVVLTVPGVDLSAPLLISWGIVNMGMGGMATQDGTRMVSSALDGRYRPTVLQEVGAQLAGSNGESVGTLATPGLGIASATPSISRGLDTIGGSGGSRSALMWGLALATSSVWPGLTECPY